MTITIPIWLAWLMGIYYAIGLLAAVVDLIRLIIGEERMR